MGVLLQKGSVKKYIFKSAIYHTLSIVLISVLLIYSHIKQQNISDHILYEYLSSVNTRVISDFLSRGTLKNNVDIANLNQILKIDGINQEISINDTKIVTSKDFEKNSAFDKDIILPNKSNIHIKISKEYNSVNLINSGAYSIIIVFILWLIVSEYRNLNLVNNVQKSIFTKNQNEVEIQNKLQQQDLRITRFLITKLIKEIYNIEDSNASYAHAFYRTDKSQTEIVNISEFKEWFQGFLGLLEIKTNLSSIKFCSQETLYQIVHSVTHFIKWLGYRNGTQKLVLDISRKKQGHSILCFTFDGFPIRNASEVIFLSEGYIASHSNMVQLNIGNVFDMAQKADFSYEVFEKNGLNHIVFTQAIVQNEDGGTILDFNTYKKNINKYKEGK